MSLSYELFKLGLKLFKVKDKQKRPIEIQIQDIIKSNEKIRLKTPLNSSLDVQKKSAENGTVYYYGKHKNSSREKEQGLLIVLHGGGYLTRLTQSELKYALSLGESTGLDVVVPNLPSCTTHSIDEVYESLSLIYKTMESEYGSNIAILGFSSGASLSVGICIHLREKYPEINLPKLIIASSPGSVPHLKEEVIAMEKLDSKDIMMSTSFMSKIGDTLKKGKDVPDYMMYTAHGDFKNLPPLHFYYGSDEILLAQMPYYKASCEKAGIKSSFVVKEGMCHCYPGMPFKEGVEGKKEIIDLLNTYFPKSNLTTE